MGRGESEKKYEVILKMTHQNVCILVRALAFTLVKKFIP